MGAVKDKMKEYQSTFNSLWDSQKELASSLIIGNRGIFDFSRAMEGVGFRGGLYNYTNANGYAEENVYKTPVNGNYVLVKPGIGPQIEGINRAETTETLFIGTPYSVRERFRKERSNALLGDINFTDLTDEEKSERMYVIDKKQPDPYYNDDDIKKKIVTSGITESDEYLPDGVTRDSAKETKTFNQLESKKNRNYLNYNIGQDTRQKVFYGIDQEQGYAYEQLLSNEKAKVPNTTIDEFVKKSYDDSEVEIKNNKDIPLDDPSATRNTGYPSKSIVQKTYSAFVKDTNEKKFKTLVSRPEIDGISRGRNLRSDGDKSIETKDSSNQPFKTNLCRVWTKYHQYNSFKDRIRPLYDKNGTLIDLRERIDLSLRPNNGATNLINYSTLNKDGLVKIAPTINDYENSKAGTNSFGGLDIKNYMFSIENLAWKDLVEKRALSKGQIGPNGGRIMWFPPYNLQFSENVSVDWEPNNFIGRGEKILTYKNTDRRGTLSFTILMDHPSSLKKINDAAEKEGDDKKILQYFAGCVDLDALDEDVVVEEEPVEEPDREPQDPTPEETYRTIKRAYFMFYPNNYSGVDAADVDDIIDVLEEYEDDENGKEAFYTDNAYSAQTLDEKNVKDKNRYQLNTEIGVVNQIASLKTTYGEQLSNVSSENIDTFCSLSALNDTIIAENLNRNDFSAEIYSFASNAGYEEKNMELIHNRNVSAQKILDEYIPGISVSNAGGEEKSVTYIGDVNEVNSKLARASVIIISQKLKEEAEPLEDGDVVETPDGEVYVDEDTEESTENNNENETIVIRSRTEDDEELTYDNEYLYFKEITNDAVGLTNIRNMVSVFTPAFHSITAEGFNARLTFLHQCTRQGPTYSASRVRKNIEGGEEVNDYQTYAGNLAFGRAPYCILRIGDFYNTKICIDSLVIEYLNGDGIQWDLNPEGVGVQPMMAKITIQFYFFGGQDLSGPIERLQNAVTANYYANASVYDRHADNKTSYYDAILDNGSEKRGRKEKIVK